MFVCMYVCLCVSVCLYRLLVLLPYLLRSFFPNEHVRLFQDVLQELIVYEHNDDEITTDMLVLHVTDGDFDDTKQLNIIIGLINDETPRVTINRGLRIKAGKRFTGLVNAICRTRGSKLNSDIILEHRLVEFCFIYDMYSFCMLRI